MSEIKRVPLISFSANKGNEKKSKEYVKSVRIAVVLPQSNEDTCPEYNYKEELAAAKRKDKTKPEPQAAPKNGLDPFNDEDDEDVRRIAQEMEAKYGGPIPKKKRKGRKDDYADIGMGYDESDSFIDNTDGYDEMIPQNVTTLHGGFYINCGALEFKTDDEASSEPYSSDSSDEEDIVKPTSRKRILELSDDSEGEKETEKPTHNEKKQKLESNGLNKIVKKKFLHPDKYKQVKKRRPSDAKSKSPTVKDLLREKREDLNMSIPNELMITEDDSEKKHPASLANINDTIEAVVKGNGEQKLNTAVEAAAKSPEMKVPENSKSLIDSASDGDNSKDSFVSKEVEIVKLPENLPGDIVDLINKIKDTASSSNEGKVKFFAGPVSDMLLSLERKCKNLGKQSRLRVYEHLALFVKCRKETLIKRAKNLVLVDDQKKITDLLSKLKTAINSIMPNLITTYEVESQKVMQKKFSKDSLENEENKHLRLPKRRFAWNEDSKKLVRELLTLRKKCFILEGKSKDSLESLMINFLKTDLQPLWPEGWMSLSALQKFLTNICEVKKVSSIPTLTSNGQRATSGITMSSISKDIPIIPTNSALSITPIIPNATTINGNVTLETKSSSVGNDLTVDRISSVEDLVKKSLPSDITKSSPSVTITPSNPTIINLTQEYERKSPEVKESKLPTSMSKTVNPTVKQSPSNLTVKQSPANLTVKSSTSAVVNPSITSSTVKPTSTSTSTIISSASTIIPSSSTVIPLSSTVIPSSSTIIPSASTIIPSASTSTIKQSHSTLAMQQSTSNSAMKQMNSTSAIQQSASISTHKQSTSSTHKQSSSSTHKQSISTSTHKQSTSTLANKQSTSTSANKQSTTSHPVSNSSIKLPSIAASSSTKTNLILLDDKNKQTPNNVQEPAATDINIPKTETNHCQVINLVEPPEVKRKSLLKTKSKYIEDFEKVLKPMEIIDKSKLKPPIEDRPMSTSTFNQLFSEFSAQALKNSSPTSTPASTKLTDHSIKKLSAPSNYSSMSLDYSKPKPSNEGDAIQKVMEDLKALQKLSSPNKNADSPASSPVSVIAYNKNFTPKSSPSASHPQSSSQSSAISGYRSDYNKADFGPGFQEAFQRQLLNDFNLMKTGVNTSTPSSSKGHYNSSDKYGHSSAGTYSNEKYYPTSNNNFPVQNSPKLKNSLPTTQAANHKPKTTQK